MQQPRSGCALAAIITVVVLASLAVVVGLAGVLLSSDSSGDETDAGGSSEATGGGSKPTQPAGPEVFKVGATAHTGDLDVTVHQAKDPFTSSSEFEQPAAGNRLVAVEIEVKDTSGQPQTFSTLIQCEVTDSLNRPWDVALAGSELPNLDGDVGPGGSRRGWVVFEVAQDAAGLKVRVKGNITATGSTFQL